MPVKAVIFDMDGVIIDSEPLWDSAREDLTRETGGSWHEQAHAAMMGMASHEWTSYMHDELGVPLSQEEISDAVVAKLSRAYRDELPLIDDACETVESIAEEWPVAIASSSNRELIDLVAELSGLDGHLTTTISSEEAGRGKPAPDVFLRAADELGVDSADCVVVEDSANGVRAAAAAAMPVIAVPHEDYPLPPDVVELTAIVTGEIGTINPTLIELASDL